MVRLLRPPLQLPMDIKCPPSPQTPLITAPALSPLHLVRVPRAFNLHVPAFVSSSLKEIGNTMVCDRSKEEVLRKYKKRARTGSGTPGVREHFQRDGSGTHEPVWTCSFDRARHAHDKARHEHVCGCRCAPLENTLSQQTRRPTRSLQSHHPSVGDMLHERPLLGSTIRLR